MAIIVKELYTTTIEYTYFVNTDDPATALETVDSGDVTPEPFNYEDLGKMHLRERWIETEDGDAA